jgi:hypothetical protein
LEIWKDIETHRKESQQTGRIMIGLSLLSSVSKHNMWSYYDWVYCSCCPSVNTICGRIDNSIITRPHIVFTDGRQQRQLNQKRTTYCVYWRTTTTTRLCCRCCSLVNTICGRIMTEFIVLVVRQ